MRTRSVALLRVLTGLARTADLHIDQAVQMRRWRVDVDFQESLSDRRPDPERKPIERNSGASGFSFFLSFCALMPIYAWRG